MSDDKIKKEKEKYIERCIKNALNSTFSNSATKKRFKVVSVFKMKNLFYCVTKEMQKDNLLSEEFNIDRIFLSLDNSFTMEIKRRKRPRRKRPIKTRRRIRKRHRKKPRILHSL